MSSEHNGSAQKHVSQSKKTEATKPTHRQQDSNHVKEDTSSGMPEKSQEKAKSVSEPIEASPDSKTKLKTSETSDEENGKTVLKEKSKTSKTLEATNSQSDNSNVSVEEKTMHDLEDAARVALNRFKNVFKTVTRVSSVSQTVDISENKGIGNEGDKKTASNQPSSADSPSTVHEKKSEAKKSEVRKGNAGRRGESGLKMSKRDTAASKEDVDRSVVADDVKLAKQKGESISMSKNGPGLKFPSKNTREMPTAELLFENQQSKGSLPVSPKHTPPLKDKESSVQVRKCENRARKKRKGEALTVECFTQGKSSGTESNVAIEQPLTTTEFSKAASNEPSTTRSDIPPLDSDGEVVLMKQTSADEISATTSSDSTASERTPEAKVREKNENETAFTEDVVKSKTSESNGENKASTNSNENSETKAGEDVLVKSKASEREIETNGKQYDQAIIENSEVKILETGEKKSTASDDVNSKTNDKEIENGKQLEQATTRSGENSESSVLEKGERKTSTAENGSKRKASDRKGVDNNENTETANVRENRKSKTAAAADVKNSRASDKKVDNGKDHSEATTNVITENPENSSDGRSSVVKASSNVNEELSTVDYKSRKTLGAKKATQNIKEQVKNAEFLHSVGAGSSVFETSFMNVHTDGSLQDLSEDECRHIEGVQALVVRNRQFSAWLSLDTKNIE